MRLDEFVEDLETDERAEMRRLAREKSYAITDYLTEFEDRFESVVSGDSLFGSVSPSIFVGRSSYPEVSTGLLSPVGDEDRATEYVTSGDWYDQGIAIEDVYQYRSGLLNSTRSARVNVEDVWDGFVGVQREVAIADRPVDVEIGLSGSPDLDFGLDDIATPTGPHARAERADLAENPSVPKAVEKTLSDDDWKAEGAMTYLYRRGFDVYEINKILSAGALGIGERRRLVPTRWSITAVDDTVGKYLRGTVRNAPSVDSVEVYTNEYVGNRYWIVLTPGNWEFELVEMKSPGSVWNPDLDGTYWVASDHEGYDGRTEYVTGGTSGAYYAARVGALEHLADRGRQAKVLVLREVTDEQWAPVGVWQVRESVRNAFDGEWGEAESLAEAVTTLSDRLPISQERLRRSSELVAGVQSSLADFGRSVG
ncbi:DNA repair protein NreA [Natronorarus salvus]|uniref:DNA repair protein NreA n=1 Tax=Natronorarus salvus TaxID=3117733 RepID=UPI002F261200